MPCFSKGRSDAQQRVTAERQGRPLYWPEFFHPYHSPSRTGQVFFAEDVEILLRPDDHQVIWRDGIYNQTNTPIHRVQIHIRPSQTSRDEMLHLEFNASYNTRTAQQIQKLVLSEEVFDVYFGPGHDILVGRVPYPGQRDIWYTPPDLDGVSVSALRIRHTCSSQQLARVQEVLSPCNIFLWEPIDIAARTQRNRIWCECVERIRECIECFWVEREIEQRSETYFYPNIGWSHEDVAQLSDVHAEGGEIVSLEIPKRAWLREAIDSDIDGAQARLEGWDDVVTENDTHRLRITLNNT